MLSDKLLEQMERAALIIKSGGVVALPTDTFTALGADALSDSALAKVRNLKKRPTLPMPIFIPQIGSVHTVAREISDDAFALAEKFWPGALTIVLRKTDTVPYGATGGLESIGIRVPNHSVTLELISMAGQPVTGTSANISGQPPVRSCTEALSIFPNLDAIVDAPCGKQKLPSTVVDMSNDVPIVVREGAIPLVELQKIIPKPKWNSG